jgi:hypothetical protein
MTPLARKARKEEVRVLRKAFFMPHRLLALVATMILGFPPAGAEDVKITTAARDALVYHGENDTSGILRFLPAGTPLEVLEKREAGWLKIRIRTGGETLDGYARTHEIIDALQDQNAATDGTRRSSLERARLGLVYHAFHNHLRGQMIPANGNQSALIVGNAFGFGHGLGVNWMVPYSPQFSVRGSAAVLETRQEGSVAQDSTAPAQETFSIQHRFLAAGLLLRFHPPATAPGWIGMGTEVDVSLDSKIMYSGTGAIPLSGEERPTYAFATLGCGYSWPLSEVLQIAVELHGSMAINTSRTLLRGGGAVGLEWRY